MIESITLIVIAIALFYVGISTLQRYNRIIKNGHETEGVIFDISSSDNLDTATINYPVVRFLTETQQWVTEKSPVSIIPRGYKKGQKVTVIYSVEKPSDFFIKSNNTRNILIAITIAAIIFLTIGIYLLLHI